MEIDIQPSKEMALFYGILAGDGCISKSKRQHLISITCSVYDDEPFIKNIVVPLLVNLRGKPVKYVNRWKEGKIEIKFSDKEFFYSIKSLGFPIGKKGNIEIPDIFPRDLYKYIVSGYFATDGCIVLADNNGILYPRIEIQSISNRILYQIKDFLISCGMSGNVYRITRRSGLYRGDVIYRMQFNGYDNLIRFKELIDFINPKQEDKFKNYMKCRCSSAVERHMKRRSS